MKNAGSPFLPALFSRFMAVLCVALLIGVLSLTGIVGIAVLGPALGHGENVDHTAGLVVSLGPGKDFVLLTAAGERLAFQCGGECRASLGHLMRHMREKAHTDVYYIEGANRTLMALDVD